MPVMLETCISDGNLFNEAARTFLIYVIQEEERQLRKKGARNINNNILDLILLGCRSKFTQEVTDKCMVRQWQVKCGSYWPPNYIL